MKIPGDFYTRKDVVLIARELIGKYLFTRMGDEITAGIVIETEAYAGEADRASHAWSGRLTERTKVMYRKGGIAYVYLCYGIHSLFNIVTNVEGIPHAILIRGVYPTYGLDVMFSRAGGARPLDRLGSGPGKVSKILGIHYSHTGTLLTGEKIWLEDRGVKVGDEDIQVSSRIGVEYAGEDARLPYRFMVDPENQAIKKAGTD